MALTLKKAIGNGERGFVGEWWRVQLNDARYLTAAPGGYHPLLLQLL